VTRTATPAEAVATGVPRGTSFVYTLSEPASARLTIAPRKLLAQLKRKKQRVRNCTRHVRVGALTRTSRQGANRVAFSGRIGRRALKAARYRTTLVATDGAGNTSAPRIVGFQVVRAKR
jgi:hypothetical protein